MGEGEAGSSTGAYRPNGHTACYLRMPPLLLLRSVPVMGSPHPCPPPLPSQISASIVTGMASANWKERKAAMDEVEGLLVSAGNRIGPKVRGLYACGCGGWVMHEGGGGPR